MLPPPMNPMFDSLIPATLSPIRIMPAITGHRGIAVTRAGGRLLATGSDGDRNHGLPLMQRPKPIRSVPTSEFRPPDKPARTNQRGSNDQDRYSIKHSNTFVTIYSSGVVRT